MAIDTKDWVFHVCRHGEPVSFDWEELISAMRKEAEIFQGRISADVLEHQYTKGWSVVLTACEAPLPKWVGIPLSHVTLYPKARGWVELGSFYTRPELQGNGLARLVFEPCVRMIKQSTSLHAFMIGKESKLRQLACETGWSKCSNLWNAEGILRLAHTDTNGSVDEQEVRQRIHRMEERESSLFVIPRPNRDLPKIRVIGL